MDRRADERSPKDVEVESNLLSFTIPWRLLEPSESHFYIQTRELHRNQTYTRVGLRDELTKLDLWKSQY